MSNAKPPNFVSFACVSLTTWPRLSVTSIVTFCLPGTLGARPLAIARAMPLK